MVLFKYSVFYIYVKYLMSAVSLSKNPSGRHLTYLVITYIGDTTINRHILQRRLLKTELRRTAT